MKLKIDENLPVEVAEFLNASGYDASTVLKQSLGGKDDIHIIDICRQEKRALVTLDLDFADVRLYPPEEYEGLIVLRLRKQDKHSVLDTFTQVIPLLDREALNQKLWIVEEHRIRIRGEED